MMRRPRHAAEWLMLLPLALSGCSGKDSAGPTNDALDFAPVLSSFANDVVVATYSDLATRAEALHDACVAFDAASTDALLLAAAANAWIAAREPWEQSEAFLFGPAAFLSLDPSLDSWPVDRQQLDQILASGFDLTPEFIAEGLGPALRGFHTVEYLLFRNQAPRDPMNVTSREREYLVSCSRVLADDASLLRDQWSGGFATEFAYAGQSGSRYQTAGDAVLEMLNGMIGICDEVANGKIATPYDEQDPQLVESQFSGNSLTDFRNNLRSVRNAYTASLDGTASAGLSELVGTLDAELDEHLREDIDEAIAAIGAIPEPFEANLGQSVAIEAAQTAITHVLLVLEKDVRPLLLD